MILRQHHGFAAAARFRDDLDAPQSFEEAAQARPEESVLRRENETERLHGVLVNS